MTKFRYIGEYPEGKTELTVFGCVFSPDAEIEVPSPFAGRARGNPFFVEVDDAPPAPDDTSLINGMTKAELIIAAEQYGITIDKRWSTARIADAIIAQALKEGMTTMYDDGITKITRGLTTIEELLRVTTTSGD